MDINEIISNVKIYDLKESLIASGYPMSTEITDLETQKLTEKDINRGIKLTYIENEYQYIIIKIIKFK